MSDPKHDVFLSFRGEDTRDNFTSHLREELRKKNIKTFKDNKLDRGKEISQALYIAIKESKIYVIILSEHYASSTWCLDELCEILKCKEIYGREVIPVFYKVDPSNVRYQKHSYADDFVKHHQRFGAKVEVWKAALTKVAGLSGWDSQVTRPESTLVTEIVKDILKKLNHCFLSDYEGMTRIEQIQSLLLLKSPTVRTIGIWGMGGIGKTTIASAIFEKLATQFSSRSIVLNVQQEIEKAGLEKVKNKYLSELLDEHITSSKSNFSFHPKLERTKVLLVFDDVKDSDQLEGLIGTHSNLGKGSRIIVTSRDRQVLENGNADEIYQVREMDHQDSLQLFCSFAFKQNHPKESFVNLANKVLGYAQGLPLALKVLGSLLYGKTEKAWENELQKLEKLPDLKVFRLLKLSYDGLDREQKNIFLDIVCFYTGRFEKVVEQSLDFCGFSARIGMDVLKDRCLISISEGEVCVHDLIKEMGHEIVRLQCEDDPGKRSRLWKSDEIYDVFKRDKGKGTDAVQCIFLNLKEIKKVQLHAKTFEKMHNLRIIQFFYGWYDSNVTFDAFLESLPNALKILRWDGFPQRSLPQDFCPENLVTLDMRDSHLEQLWEGDQALPKLKRLNLMDSEKLIGVPDLSLSPNIEEVILSNCVSLIQVYSSSFLNNLNWLCLDGCIKLERLDICSNILSRSSGLVALHGCCNLETLLISNTTDVIQLHSSPPFTQYYIDSSIRVFDGEMYIRHDDKGGYEILNLPSWNFTRINELCWLDVSDCMSLTCLPAELLNLKFLRRLCLSGCSKLEELPEIEETMENLKVLMLDGTSIKELRSSIHRLVGLEELSLYRCTKLKTIPSSIGNLSKLLKLDLSCCESLETFPSSIFKLKLTELNFDGCSMFRIFPEIPYGIGRLSSSTKLSLQGSSIVNLPESMTHLLSLKSLDLSDCKLLECVPKLPPNLNQVLAFNCPSIKSVVVDLRLKLMSDSKDAIFEFQLTSSQELDAYFWRNFVHQAFVMISGRAIYCWFHYRVQRHSVTMENDSLIFCSKNRLIGLALCVVLGRGTRETGGRSLRYKLGFEYDYGLTHFFYDDLPMHNLNWKGGDRFIIQDHTIIWKHQFDLAKIGIKLTNAYNFTLDILDENSRSLRYQSSTFEVKECGLCPLYTNENDDE